MGVNMEFKSKMRMLCLYFSAQKAYKDNLAFPLMRAVCPVIDVDECDYGLLIEKALPQMKEKVDFDLLYSWIKKNFSKIENDEIRMTKFFSHSLKVDDFFDAVQKHDIFIAFCKEIFHQLSLMDSEGAGSVRANAMKKIDAYFNGLSKQELKMLMRMFNDFRRRPALSMGEENLVNIIEILHQCVADYRCSNTADLMLSNAARNISSIPDSYNVYNFIRM